MSPWMQQADGSSWIPNQATSVDLMHELLENCERQTSTDLINKHKWESLVGGYLCICFVLSLRSPEGLMDDLEDLIHFIEERRRT